MSLLIVLVQIAGPKSEQLVVIDLDFIFSFFIYVLVFILISGVVALYGFLLDLAIVVHFVYFVTLERILVLEVENYLENGKAFSLAFLARGMIVHQGV